MSLLQNLRKVPAFDQFDDCKICFTVVPCALAFDVAAALVEWALYFEVSMPASPIIVLNHLAMVGGVTG